MKLLIQAAIIFGAYHVIMGISQALYEMENPSDPISVEFDESAKEMHRLRCQMVRDCF